MKKGGDLKCAALVEKRGVEPVNQIALNTHAASNAALTFNPKAAVAWGMFRIEIIDTPQAAIDAVNEHFWKLI